MSRDNAYYLDRLRRAGRTDLIKKIEAEEMSVYAATIEAGIRKKRSAPSRADQLSYHWSRASHSERRRFLKHEWSSVGPIVGDFLRASRAKRGKVETPS